MPPWSDRPGECRPLRRRGHGSEDTSKGKDMMHLDLRRARPVPEMRFAVTGNFASQNDLPA